MNRALAWRLPRPGQIASSSNALVLVGLAAALSLVAAASIGVGAVTSSPGQTLAILAARAGIGLPWSFEAQQEAVVFAVRLPRVVLGILVGAGLGTAGAAMQGLFRNPLADPSLLGVSTGAALAAAATVVLGAPIGTLAALGRPVAAFAGALVATLAVYRLARTEHGTSVGALLLAGIGVNALAAALTGLLIFVADDTQLRAITFWGLGSLGGATWAVVAPTSLFLIVSTVALSLRATDLNALALGVAEAGHLGVDVPRLERYLVVFAALAVGAGVAVTGGIGFVAMVAPHILRLAVGPDHRFLLVGSGLFGAALLLGADLVARTAVAPAELPIGIVTALIGAPFFLWLLVRGRLRSAV
jgi:iron complex transport system permease protein